MTAQLPLSLRVAQLRDCLDQLKLARRELEKSALDIFAAQAVRRIICVQEGLISDALRYGKGDAA